MSCELCGVRHALSNTFISQLLIEDGKGMSDKALKVGSEKKAGWAMSFGDCLRQVL